MTNKINSSQAITFVKATLMALVGIVGFKTLNTMIESRFPQFAKYTGIAELAAAFAASVYGNDIVKHVAKGGALYAAMNLLGSWVPAGSGMHQYIPQVSGINGLQLGSASADLTLGLPQYGSEFDYQGQESSPNLVAG